jgi:uncharacterized protein (DUF305 family)
MKLVYIQLSLVFAIAFFASSAFAQSGGPVIVRPGAPGEVTKVLPADTKAVLPAVSPKDIEFMQGMIMHHAQAVEMTAMIATRTKNKDIELIGQRISKSQAEEMAFMKRWLALRGESTEMGHSSNGGHSMLMPGMLTKREMDALRSSSGPEFDRRFLEGMIKHHEGALEMVDDLHKSPGAAQNAELFSFATDVDTGQRAEIKSMETVLTKLSYKRKN